MPAKDCYWHVTCWKEQLTYICFWYGECAVNNLESTFDTMEKKVQLTCACMWHVGKRKRNCCENVSVFDMCLHVAWWKRDCRWDVQIFNEILRWGDDKCILKSVNVILLKNNVLLFFLWKICSCLLLVRVCRHYWKIWLWNRQSMVWYRWFY